MQAQVWEIPSLRAPAVRRATREVGEPGPGEVLVGVRATSLNFRDLLQLQGTYNPRQPFPVVPCSDAAGVALAIGQNVTEFQVGDRVVNHALPGWQAGPYTDQKISVGYGGPHDGTLTTHRLFPSNALVHIPRSLSFAQAATLPVAALTAWSAVFTHSAVKPGDLVVIQGTGGVSLFALQFALAAGAVTVITSSSDAKLERASAMGADYCLNYSKEPDWAKALKTATGGRGADLVIEVAGDLEQSVRAVRAGGTIALIGVLADAKPPLNLPLVVMRGVRLQGITLGSFMEMKAMVAAIGHKQIQPVIDRSFAFGDAVDAFDYYASAKMFGKVVIETP